MSYLQFNVSMTLQLCIVEVLLRQCKTVIEEHLDAVFQTAKKQFLTNGTTAICSVKQLLEI
jgi:hypothetical protein